ncbi:hypothetical protein F7725_026986 [Dissostichus mawsoni]|uniref:Uncharacterized protein n=1 Tax=Dissostichus mawsoni TaxID=36200 RepID=A0A7J5X8T2_DISMA|nr:hypothetical protein F7725_026986 [Dissostichus mawsoni]
MRLIALYRQKAARTGKEVQDVHMKRNAALEALPLYLREEDPQLFNYFKSILQLDSMHFQAEEVDRPDITNTPVAIVSVVTEGTTSQVDLSRASTAILVEGDFVISNIPRMADSFALLFGLMYVLHLDYPKKLINTFTFIQKAAAGLLGEDQAADVDQKEDQAAAGLKDQYQDQAAAGLQVEDRDHAAAGLQDEDQAAAGLKDEDQAAAGLKNEDQAAAGLKDEDQAAAGLKDSLQLLKTTLHPCQVEQSDDPDIDDVAVGLLLISARSTNATLFCPERIAVVLEGNRVIELPTLADAFILLFALIFTLYLSYPKDLANTLDFTQNSPVGFPQHSADVEGF